MKKLIEELELERADMSRSNCDYGELSGFAAAVDIVRAHNPWHEVVELPPEWEQYRKQSINVLVLSEEGKVEISYYHFGFKSWGATFAPIGWTYLPEVKP
jgi:hypothetical protein